MDAVDRQIIAVLRGNGRATYADLGRQVGLSASAVHERVGKLEAAGVITGYHAVVNPGLVGLGVTALVGIHPSDTGDDEEVACALAKLPEVESCYAVAGDEAFVIKVRVATVDDLERTLFRLRRIEGVARTNTTVVLSTRFEGRPNVPEDSNGPEDSTPPRSQAHAE
ncbi:MAG: Lrp/AsnC family transcriptional regulator [Kutzneria sp.]|nr:Lrp/AsnC family transcriptional regulator [Kutzneria sp.]MBV9845079.1 Lrp/AsnC family transcriptional regulator [Kutzneria sp.]